MSGPFKKISGLNRLIHQPSRLAITTALSACERADFLYLQKLTGLSKGNLSSHLSRLENADVVKITKTFQGKTPQTWIELTDKGRSAVASYWDQMERVREGAENWERGGEREGE